MSNQKKYDLFKNRKANPKLWITDYFDSVTNEIDMDAEMINFSVPNYENNHLEGHIAKANLIRTKMIEKIKEIQNKNLENLENNLEKINDDFFGPKNDADLINDIFKSFCFYIKRNEMIHYKGFHFGILLESEWSITDAVSSILLFILKEAKRKIRKKKKSYWGVYNYMNDDPVTLDQDLMEGLYYEEQISKFEESNSNVIRLNRLIFEDIKIVGLNYFKLILNPNVFHGYKNLQYLNLSNNHISKIVDNIFDDLQNLKNLILSNNSIETISDKAFQGLINLKRLCLDSNRIVRIKDGIFDCVSDLEELYLDINSIDSISENAFQSLKNLRNLNLDFNYINHLDPSHFKNFKKLEILDCSNNLFRNLYKNTFQDMKNLRRLNLSECGISFIDQGAFNGLIKLEELNLENNLFNRLYPDTFDGLFNLKRIYLRWTEAFMQVPDEELDQNLRHQLEIKDIGRLINGLNKLEYIDFSRFTWKREHIQSFKLNDSIKQIDLSQINLNSYDAIESLGLDRVELLKLNITEKGKMNLHNNNKLTDFLKKLKNLKSLSLNLPDVNDRCFKRNFHNKFLNLRSLKLECLKIKRVKNDTFQTFAYLQYFDLSRNNIEFIEEYAFKELNLLKELNLSKNKIKKLSKNGFHGLKCLKKLNLSKNKISYLDKETFSSLCTLTELYINNNNLSNINGLFDQLDLLERLSLCGNILDLQGNELDNLTRLEILQMNGVGMSTLNNRLFSKISKLKALELKQNSIKVLDEESFSNLKSLESLDLSDNEISEFCFDHYKSLENLVNLNLSKNSISDLNVNSFKHFKSLENISFKKNFIENVSDELLDNLGPTLILVDLDSNPCSQHYLLYGRRPVNFFK